ncbi:ABC transporter substrate-binding protein [Deinococcus sp.]|uniref:ABC transporter substrate-binding protein n=1 Tax=Deinococcus sp. TaxID=47478 RepID=UPI003CC6B0BA
MSLALLSRTGASLAATVADDPVSISLLAGGNDPASIKLTTDLANSFMKANPSVKVKVETRPGGTDGDNLIKTRLATKTMNDVFFYNSGSLLQALQPDNQLVDQSDQPWAKLVTPDFRKAVGTSKGLYGAPIGSTFNGGIMYNKKVYAKLGLSVPKTWAAFISNSQKIKAAGIIPVLVSYGDTWTSQLFVLADFANVTAQVPDWSAKYTANKAKYANPPALAGFAHTEEIYKKQLMNRDFASLTNVNALKLLATGQAAHYPMITAVIGNVVQSNPGQVNDIGYFAVPSDAGTPHATVWEASGAYIPKSTTGAKLAAAEKLVAFLNSPAGCEIQNSAGTVAGPYAISSCKVPSGAPALVADELKYQEARQTGLALEFLSPIKGPNLEKILVQVGSGISSTKVGADLYDQDVTQQAQQLGLPGW